jgi:hypothetical protein
LMTPACFRRLMSIHSFLSHPDGGEVEYQVRRTMPSISFE